ncbi:thiamine pyrophosphate-dependent enzyme [Phreatobacter sp.]|uniref:thiamine pyrophosphate-dependent enzyme n=1 Tax=Phreatobacter sp. TaxID=1966341 RepID=UPI003F70087B
MTRRMTGGEAIVAGLLANGVDTVFGLPGAQMYPLFDALAQNADRIRTIGARHEQACGYMAFGYGRSTGRTGVYSVVPGPGLLNTTAALATGWGCNTPMVCLTGQIPSPFIGRRRGHLHEIADQLGTLRSLVKWAERIERPADAPALVAEAFRQAQSGRPGPVALEMAWDVMASAEDVPVAQAGTTDPGPEPDRMAVSHAANLIRAAKLPIIMTGSGAQHASAGIARLSELTGAPVAAFRGGRGVTDEAGPWGLSSYAAFRLYRDCDLVIAIGTRLEMPTMRWANMMEVMTGLDGGRKLIRIDIDPEEMTRLAADAGIVADSAEGVAALIAALDGHRAPDNRAAIEAARREAADAIRVVQPEMDHLDAIRAVLPADGLLVEELCQAGFASYFGYPVHQPRTYVSTGFQGTLGYGFQTALGVKAAHPERDVVSITGDGGFLFGVQELATAVQYRLGLVTVVFNNHAYGNVRRDQETRYGNRLIGADLHNPDFPALARSFGLEGTTVTSAAELRPALARALAAARATSLPSLIEVKVARGSEASPWPFIHPVKAY